MKIASYKELLKSEEQFNCLLSKYNIPITNRDRIHKSYKLISDFDKVRKNFKKRNLFLLQNGGDSAIRFAEFDLDLIHFVVPFILQDDNPTIKKKLKKILKASAPSDESLKNNEARNTLFELLFFSYLRSVNIPAELRDPNPDIFVRIGNREYFIQCKRVFSDDDKAIRSNVLNGVRQLDTDLKNQGKNSRGILALSVERRITQGNKRLDAPTGDSALSEVNNSLKQIVKQCGQFWQDFTIVTDKRFVAVFLHHLVSTVIKSENLHTIVHYILANNTIYPATREYSQFSEDFGLPLKSIDS